ncbi:Gypsy retrotransposon integrase-like protein 1 [Vitis vinifera]|uniref:Gypsy retrotransposon integrase-like protein 1 n=1 Tax=Vitis vinifera TaxID=29760 RepID=A0A438CBC2_VITVI|nr:Gypsy retrotransposon integrase-like protein 1 [Vitis vinifera]
MEDSSHSDSKGKKSRSGPRLLDVGTIGMTEHKSAHRPPFQSKFLGTPYQMIQHDWYRPVAPIKPAGTAYLHPPPQPVYATQAPQRPPMQFHHQYRAPPPPSHRPLPTHDTRAVPPPPKGVAQPPPVDKPFAGIAAKEEVQREDDEILLQLRTTQARISIWSLLASPSTHRDALVRALGQIRVDTATTPEGLIHMLTADRATCRRVTSVLLDNGSAMNNVRAYDETQRTIMGTLSTHVMIRPVSYSIVFQVLRIQSSFNLLLGHPWIHEAGAIPSSLHQKVKFIHEGHIITIQPDRDIITSSELVLHISHSENDLHLIGFTFDEVQVVSLEDGGKDMGTRACTRTEGTVRIPETVEIQDIQQALGQMQLNTGTTEMPGAMIVAPHHQTELAVSSMQFYTGPILLSICSEFLYSRLMRMTLFPDAIGIGLLDVVTFYSTSIEGASDSVDPRLFSDTMSRFVTCFDDISNDNNDMSIFKYLTVSQHFPLIAPPALTTHIYDVDDVGDTDDPLGDQPREIRIGSSLSPEERSRLIDMLRPVKQKLRRLHPRWSLHVKEEIRKQLSVGFLSVVEYPKWLANVVPIPRKDGKVRVCVDFRDLNKAIPKDDFPSHTLICWLIALQGIRCCPSWMDFLDVEVYVDDMIVKSRDRTDHLAALQRFFERIRQFRLRLNPKKCTFGVASGKLLGHIVSERGIEIDPEKIRAILDMPAPRTEKEIKVSDMALGCMLAQLDDLGKERAIYYLSKRMLEYECKYIMIERLCLALVWATRRLRHYMTEYSALGLTIGPVEKSVKGSIVADHLASLPISDDRSVDDDFPDEQIVSMTSITGWRLYFDGAANQSGFGIANSGYLEDSDEKLKPYHAYLDLLIDGFDVLRYRHLPRAENQFADALATLASMIVIPAGVTVRPLLLKQESPDGLLLLCLDRTSADRVMREVHAGVCGPHMGGHMLACKIMRAGYFWLTMETDCCQFVQRCQECQMHGDLIHVPPSELHALTSPWPFSVWGVDIIGKISPKSSSGHEYILVAIDYFTKWVEAASYARLTAARVAKFIRSHIICRYGVPHELISDRGVHFRGEVDTLIQEYGIQHHRSSAYSRKLTGHIPCSGLSEKDDPCIQKEVRPRKFQRGNLVLKVLRGLISDPRGKFRPSWSGPYVIRDLTREGAAWLTDLDGNQFTKPVNVDQLKKFYV